MKRQILKINSGQALIWLVYKRGQARRDELSGAEQIFHSGFKVFARLHQANVHAPDAVVNGASRAMRVSFNRELESLETHIPF